jgi:GntR family transcriptional repressor for pyruvate dehydrogenase complex
MHVVIADITSGEIRPGEMLPREADLADRFDVSRGIARECIRGLEERGLITVKHGRGATVTAESEWDVLSPEVLAALIGGPRGTQVLGEYLECRRILEIEAAGLAAARAGGRDLDALATALSLMTAGAERAAVHPAAETAYHEADIAFHRAVISAAGNRALGRMTAPIHRALAEARRPLARPERRLERAIPEHRRILIAIADGDTAEARAAMRDHLETVEEYLHEYARSVGGGAVEPVPTPRPS